MLSENTNKSINTSELEFGRDYSLFRSCHDKGQFIGFKVECTPTEQDGKMTISNEEIADLIRAEIDAAQVEVAGADGKYQVSVISDEFKELNAVKRQQRIYRIINEHISSGVIHAVNMHLKTVAEHTAE
tara:strand:- start:2657 stop:3043 length:387 start_codon:yes stop_codon:yes gene_type:complete